MLRGWTRADQIDLIQEIALLARQAETLASQERASRRADGLAGAAHDLLRRSRPVLARLRQDLDRGADPRDTRHDLSSLHRLLAWQVARAEEQRHGNQP